MKIALATAPVDLRRCFPVMVQLRTHLTEDEFVARAERQATLYGYQIAYAEEQGQVCAVAGFRISECLFSGKFLYIDDLITDAAQRSKRYGDALFDWLLDRARQQGCAELTLESGVQRHDAHRFYLRKRMKIASYHFSLPIR